MSDVEDAFVGEEAELPKCTVTSGLAKRKWNYTTSPTYLIEAGAPVASEVKP